ncbi:penicillin acylase family protein [Algoriphagus taiwanensis]|uniref:Penicillin acylase family protein n=1 Tax=Algoriphagus taiwanensis TaxID=1445656 RepID=A0ABQ6Q4A8_9BACT|nr:penicillin acylase family protein [Algoriphagus taiwanensis]
MKKFLSLLGFVSFLLIVGILVLIFIKSPKYNGEVSLPGLSQSTEVYFDEYGIPHIYAQNESDAYRALGYIHAQERLFQLEMMRRVGSGTLAEFLGKDLLEVDQFFHTLGIPKHAKESTETLIAQGTTPWRTASEAYIEGVNEFIAHGNLPVEYLLLGEKPRPYTLEDMHSIVGYMSFTFAMAVKTDPLLTKISRNFGPEYLNSLAVETLPEHHVIPVHYPDSTTSISTSTSTLTALLEKIPVPQLQGSNAWVISGNRTQSEKVIFSNDTHIGFSSPSVWFEAHLEYPGFSFYGNHLAGIPFGFMGNNRHHSIGLTMFENDDQDFFEEKLNPENPNEILIGEEAFPIQTRKEIIRVKGQDPVEWEIRETPHGPIINPVVKEIADLTSNPVSSWWVYLLEPAKSFEAVYKMNHAQSITEVAEAVALIHAPGLNIMYGDAEGNIAWWAAAKLPIRGKKAHSKIIADGSDPETQPKGWYPFEENPKSINPPSGFVASANNQPDSTRGGHLFPGYYFPGERWNRIAKTISSRSDWDVKSLQSLQLETINEVFPQIAQFMLAEVNREDFEEFAEALERLETWDGDHQIKKTEPTLFYKWLLHTWRLAMEDELGKEGFEAFLQTFIMVNSNRHFITKEDNPWWDKQDTPEKETREDIIREALSLSLNELSQQLGNNPKEWNWEKVVNLVHPHPLGSQKPLDKLFNVQAGPIAGNEEAVNKLTLKPMPDGTYQVVAGPAIRIMLDFGDLENSVSVLPTGNSGNRFSKHYADQKELFVKGKYRPQEMNEARIKERSENKLILNPAD